jgi:hypothetical protein
MDGYKVPSAKNIIRQMFIGLALRAKNLFIAPQLSATFATA